jgi:hypothetical protein
MKSSAEIAKDMVRLNSTLILSMIDWAEAHPEATMEDLRVQWAHILDEGFQYVEFGDEPSRRRS